MPLLETPRTLARDGGWKRHLAADPDYLNSRYRNFQINTGVPKSVFLPFAQQFNGRPILPVGTVITVHNASPSQTVDVLYQSVTDSPVTHPLLAGRSSFFVLAGYSASGRGGRWHAYLGNGVHGNGPAYADGFRADLVVSGSRLRYNVLQECVALGYDGTQPAAVTVLIPSNVVLGSETNLLPSFSTGGDAPIAGVNWFAGSQIFVRNEGVIQGYGGRGGAGGTGGTGNVGTAGEDGGPAMRIRINTWLTNHGRVLGGCGGGGGGSNSLTLVGVNGGGGGGGCGANVLRSGAVVGGAPGGRGGNGATDGLWGSPELGGDPGIGSTLVAVVTTVGGRGGAGGQLTPTTLVPNAGSPGRLVNDAGDNSNAGGAAGPAISRHASATLTVVVGSSGIVGGATVVV